MDAVAVVSPAVLPHINLDGSQGPQGSSREISKRLWDVADGGCLVANAPGAVLALFLASSELGVLVVAGLVEWPRLQPMTLCAHEPGRFTGPELEVPRPCTHPCSSRVFLGEGKPKLLFSHASILPRPLPPDTLPLLVRKRVDGMAELEVFIPLLL